jgi:hypothetical protein
MHSNELLAQLAHFTGSSTFVRHGLVRTMIMTEGVAFLAEARRRPLAHRCHRQLPARTSRAVRALPGVAIGGRSR